MQIFLGADHAGFTAKNAVAAYLRTHSAHEVHDFGPATPDPADDYPDIAARVASAVHAAGDEARGILFCGSAEGVCMAANKFVGIRAGIGYSIAATQSMRRDNDANILCLPGRLPVQDDIFAILEMFLGTPFSQEERHVRRKSKLDLF
jgi:ribose 5-phosphate isomerase B